MSAGTISIVSQATSGARQCQPCTACCDGWLKISVFDVPVLPGKPCPHSMGPVTKDGGGGCKIYAERPHDPCINFQCGWVKGNTGGDASEVVLPDWMQPHLAKVIVLPNWATWRTFPVDLAMPVGYRVPAKALKWLQEHSKKTFRPLIFTEQEVNARGHYTGEQKVYGYGPTTFQQEMTSVIAGRGLN
jgi:hypothetical protein